MAAVVDFDFKRVSEFKGKDVDELIDNLSEEKIQKGNNILNEMGAISNNE